MTFRRFRRQPVVQAVEFRGVSQPRTFYDAGEAFSPSNVPLPRVQNVHRLFDLERIASRSLNVWGDGGRTESPIQSLRRVFRSPVVSRAVVVGPKLPFPHRPPAKPSDLRRIQASLREFNRLRADPRTAMCLRRSQRREVLFALRVAGRSGAGWPRPRRRTENSNWSC